MSQVNSYKDLQIWHKAMDIAEQVYKLSETFPGNEMFGITSQIRRAAVSVSLNIAEGHGKHYTKSFVSFLRNARGSTNEVESALLLCIRLKFISEDGCKAVFNLIQEEIKMINSLISKLDNGD